MTTYTTAAEDAARIRKTLKAAKIANSRQVSVRAKSYSLGSSLTISINDPAVDIREVKTVAASSERVSYDSQTGEILCGGNRHLFVAYSEQAAETFAAANAEALANLLAGKVIEIDGKTLMVSPNETFAGDFELRRLDEVSIRWLPRREHLNPVTLAAAILAARGA